MPKTTPQTIPSTIAQATAAATPRLARATASRSGLLRATVSALLATSALVAPARAASPFTASWLGQRGAGAASSSGGSSAAALTGPGGASASAAAAAMAGPSAAALANVQRSMANLRRAALALGTATVAQAQARATAALLPTSVPDGLTLGGLVPVQGAVAGQPGWIGARLPTQAVAAGRAQVTVTQTAPQALLYWKNFNVGRNTTLSFDQSAGGAASGSWVAVNEISDVSQNPTQILGAVSAPGQVYIINPNGIIFGATSQVNVGALLASTALINGGDAQFLKTGIYSPTSIDSKGSLSLLPAFVGATRGIEVDAGAQIATNAPSSPLATGGYVLMLGSSVQNAGQIVTGDGQTGLAAGQDFTLEPGYSVASAGGATTGNLTATTRGTEIAVANGGLVGNTGVISASTGDITLVGREVVQAGVALATTSTVQRGTIHLLTDTADPTASVILAPDSTTAITLDPNGGEALTSQREGAIAASASADATRITPGAGTTLLNDQVGLPDRQDLSRIEITTGGLVDFQAGSLTLATGGQIAVSARTLPSGAKGLTATDTFGRVFVEGGAVLDVSGADSATLPVAANAVEVNVQGFELRDAPDNRDTGALSSQNVYVDQRLLVDVPASAAYATDRLYTQGGLLEVSGEVGNVSHGLGEFDSVGGTITLSSAQVIAQPGADFNISGGSIAYAGGEVPTSWLIGSDGRLYNVNTAPANLTYLGVFGGYSYTHARWQVTQTYFNPLVAPAETYDPGYTVGRDAGQLLLSTPTALFQGQIDAGVVAGQLQDTAPVATLSDPYLQPQSAVPRSGTLALGNYDLGLATLPQGALGAGSTLPRGTFATNVTFGTTIETTASSIDATAFLPKASLGTAYFSAASVSGFGLGTLSVAVGGKRTENSGLIDVLAPLAVVPGGTVALSGGDISVQAPITAPGGVVKLATQAITTLVTTTPSLSVLGHLGTTRVTLGTGAVIDTEGLWVNLPAGGALADTAFVSGGSVTVDSSGTLILGSGSTIDASAGGAQLFAGEQSAGSGGSVTLIGDDPHLMAPITANAQGARLAGPVLLDGVIRSIGGLLESSTVNPGGTFDLVVPQVLIGDGLVAKSPFEAVLPTQFFQTGFADYVVNAFGLGQPITKGSAPIATDATLPVLTVASGAQVTVAEPVLRFTAASQFAPNGSDPRSALLATLLPDYIIDPMRASITARPGASLALDSAVSVSGTIATGGAIDIGAGALVQVDAGQSISVAAVGQLTVDGTLRAPGGTIALLNQRQQTSGGNLTYLPGLSVWVGPTATLDASAQAVMAEDLSGRPFGVVPAGGTIVLGALPPSAQTVTPPILSTNAAIIIRPGALVDASGTSGVISSDAGLGATASASSPVAVASDGGTISLSSYTGIYPDGTLVAKAGGPGAQGGLFEIAQETPIYSGADQVPAFLYNPHEIVVRQQAQPLLLPPGTYPGDPATFAGARTSLVNQAYLGVDQLTDGGFTRLAAYTHDILMFDGDVSLDLGQSASLEVGAMVDSDRTAHVSIAAPYLLVGSPTPELAANTGESAKFPLYVDALSGGTPSSLSQVQPASAVPVCFQPGVGCVSANLSLTGDLIDIQNGLQFGIHAVQEPNTVPGLKKPRTVDMSGFGDVTFTSAGDIRFMPAPSSSVRVVASGDVTLAAAQIYPVTPFAPGQTASVDAGVSLLKASSGTSIDPRSVLTIERTTTALPPGPLSAFGAIAFGAATIEQGGVVRAPQGSISFGNSAFNSNEVQQLDLLPGSVTSVSANGLTIPFGGTVSGTQYFYDNQPVTTVELNGFLDILWGSAGVAPDQSSNVGVVAKTAALRIEAGATIDLSGGGTLAGGGGEYLLSQTGASPTLLSQGFISGRGGSTDTLVTPLLTFSGGKVTAPVLQDGSTSIPGSVGVFALVPGRASGYAPVTGFDLSGANASSGYYGSTPVAGEQITLSSATAGLPAGTYTLYPSYYALLPGAYRVEFGQSALNALTATGSLGTGSFTVPGFVSYANTAVRASLPVAVTVTPGAVVGSYSEYDTEGYAQFVTGVVTQFGGVRPNLPQDAKYLALDLLRAPRPLTALTQSGTLLFDPAPGGYGGAAYVSADVTAAGSKVFTPTSAYLEVTAGATATPGFNGVSVQASQLDALGAPDLVIGSLPGPPSPLPPGSGGASSAQAVVIRSGAVIGAPEIDIPLNSPLGISQSGPTLLVIEQGATLSTLGFGPAPVIASRGPYPAVGDGVFLANGNVTLDPASGASSVIQLGGCFGTGYCTSAPVSLLSDGALIIAGQVTNGGTKLGDGALRLGAESFTALAPGVTLSGVPVFPMPGGFTLTQSEVSALIAGDPALGIPALQQLTLAASGSLDIAGPFTLGGANPATGQPSLAQITLQTPVISGAGFAGQVATISAGTVTWATQATSAPAITSTGTGTLDIVADQIVLGYPAQSDIVTNTTTHRLASGFTVVNLTASADISSTNKSSLAVYAAPGTYENGVGFVGTGGTLNLDTPLVTGGPGSVLRIVAGGPIALQPPTGAAPSTATTASLGGELDLVAPSIADDTAIVLPDGRVTMTAQTGDITLGAGSRILVPGLATTLIDQTRYSPGGSVVLESTAGNVTQAAGGVIDVSSVGAAAGTIAITAMGSTNGSGDANVSGGIVSGGLVSLAGSLVGGGGPGQLGGSIDVRAATLSAAGFISLNQQLNAGAFNGGRTFEIATGSLSFGNDPASLAPLLQAHAIDISVDAGSLTIDGTVDAAGSAPGTIRLASSGDLTLATGSVLDAHGTVPQLDSLSTPIDALNTGSVELAVSGGVNGANTITGTLIVQSGVTIDVSAPAGIACALGPCGKVEFDAPRIGSATSGKVAISAPGGVSILGAGSIAVNAFWNYAPKVPAAGTGTASPVGYVVQSKPTTSETLLAGAVVLDAVNRESDAFISAATTTDASGATILAPALQATLGGLDAGSNAQYFHLRPGVQVTTSAPGEGLTVAGDVDLSQYRYASVNPAVQAIQAKGVWGSGEPGVLVLRAAGDLTINGSINDGFGVGKSTSAAPQIRTPDDQGWVLQSGAPLTGDVVIPATLPGVTSLLAGTKLSFVSSLNFAVPLAGVTLGKGEPVPSGLAGGTATLGKSVTITASFVATGSIVVKGGVSYGAGDTVPAGTVLPGGKTLLGAGAILPVDATLQNLVWPAGASLSPLKGVLKLAKTVVLQPGDILPAGLAPELQQMLPVAGGKPKTVTTILLRPVDAGANAKIAGSQGVVYGALPMLGADPTDPGASTPGILSWSMRLVGGADTAAADTRAIQPATILQTQATGADPAPGSVVMSDPHFTNPAQGVFTDVFSVVRTGTGYLDVLAGGNVAENTPYGVYTAGDEAAPADSAAYDRPRQSVFKSGKGGSVLGQVGSTRLTGGPSYEDLVAPDSKSDLYQANYPVAGGDLLIEGQGSVSGTDVSYQASAGPRLGLPDSNAVGNWLWRQGGNNLETAWWINFGTYATFQNSTPTLVTELIGFTGYGALGGGNATVVAGSNAGYGVGDTDGKLTDVSTGLDVAVGSTWQGGIDASTGAPAYLGGGTLTVTVGGTLNPDTLFTATQRSLAAQGLEAGLYGTLTDLRGNMAVAAGTIGGITFTTVNSLVVDPRSLPPGTNESAVASGGPVVVPGDGSVDLFARSDLVLTGAGDPGRVTQEEIAAAVSGAVTPRSGLQESWFTLWQPTTSISLFSAGGNVEPIVEVPLSQSQTTNLDPNGNSTATDYRYVYPPVLNVTAASGSVYVQKPNDNLTSPHPTALEVAPSPDGFVDLLAQNSIYANAARIGLDPSDQSNGQYQAIPVDVSGADPADVPSPTDPAYAVAQASKFVGNTDLQAHAILQSATNELVGLPLFAFEADTASPTTHAGADSIAHFYAVTGDVVDLQVGELLTFSAPQTPAIWQIGGEPVRIVAGNDIVQNGLPPQPPSFLSSGAATGVAAFHAADITGITALLGKSNTSLTGDLIVNTSTSDVSEITAGRDIIYLNADVAGPGRLLVQAGRNLYQADQGVIESLGLVDRNAASASGGAGLTLIAGTGATGPNYAAFAEQYFNPANLADPTTPLQDQPGKVPETYQAQLLAFLQQNFGYTGSAGGALAAFLALSPTDQAAFVLPVFYGELNQAGIEYNDASSRFYKTYLRGNLAIAALLPLYSGIGYDGAITLYNSTNQIGSNAPYPTASGIRTDYGGDIQVLVPGGGLSLGSETALAPPSSSGIITQGSGDIDIYSEGSVLLGQSRILTTFGGNVLIWSRQGDINAGRGSKSSVISTPVGIVYDNYGDVTLSPTVPSTGAGIGSLAPIPSVPPGDLNLIAPQGTIDAGEAGIRSSGNANLAALAVVNASNIQSKGSTTGVPTVQAPNLGALTAASAVAGAQQQASTMAAQANQQQTPSIITVEVISFGP